MKIHFYHVDILPKILLCRVLSTAAKYLALPRATEIAVSFVSKEEIQLLNKQTRNVDKPTDVLSFPVVQLNKQPIDLTKFSADINPETGRLALGDIVVCRQVAIFQAKEYGHSTSRELAFLALHGMLHLLGYDHIIEADEREMVQLAEAILAKCHLKRKK
jgi:probable rRNA maturation factor